MSLRLLDQISFCFDSPLSEYRHFLSNTEMVGPVSAACTRLAVLCLQQLHRCIIAWGCLLAQPCSAVQPHRLGQGEGCSVCFPLAGN